MGKKRTKSHKARAYLAQVLPFGIITALYSILFALLEKGLMGDQTVYPSTGNAYSFKLLVPTLTSALAGLAVGTFELLYLRHKFKRSAFLQKMVLKTGIYMLLLSGTILFVVLVTNAFQLGLSPWHQEVRLSAYRVFSNFAFWSILAYYSTVVLLCLFYMEVSNSIGQSILLSFFTGKYHHPKQEERVFMFLDMKSSTTIAEQLGHIRYFELLKEYYADLSDPILEYGGEIYQYVGDEVVISWKPRPSGPDKSCVHCFYAMQERLKSKEAKYMQHFGLAPSFKAGLHVGKVTAGEIGVIKKDIVFSGDVLNTTARIQGLCNEYGVDILLSKRLLDRLGLSALFKPKALGEVELRGRNERISLFTLERLSSDTE